MMSSVMPTVPANDQMSLVKSISSPQRGDHTSEALHACVGFGTRLGIRPRLRLGLRLGLGLGLGAGLGTSTSANMRPDSDDDPDDEAASSISLIQVPSLANGTTSRSSGPSTMPARSSPRMAGSVHFRKSRPQPHTDMRYSTTPNRMSKLTPAMVSPGSRRRVGPKGSATTRGCFHLEKDKSLFVVTRSGRYRTNRKLAFRTAVSSAGRAGPWV